MTDNDAAIIALHRYFIWADEMKRSFEKTIAGKAAAPAWGSEESIRANMYMCVWYGFLRAVVEGWGELKLADPTIDSVLSMKSGRTTKVSDAAGVEHDVPETYSDMLRKVRNAVFHFQPEYVDDRLVKFMEKKESVAWVRLLHGNLSRWFMAWLDSRHSHRQ